MTTKKEGQLNETGQPENYYLHNSKQSAKIGNNSQKFITQGKKVYPEKLTAIIATAIVTTGNGLTAQPTASPKPRKQPYKKPQAVKDLEAMANADNERRHPNTPPKYLAKAQYRDDTANGLTKCIIHFIRLNGGQAERINTTGVAVDNRRTVTDVLGHSRTIGSIEWRPSGVTVGSADISATIHGRSVKVEVKIGRDKQSAAQLQYQAEIEAAGGLYFIARDFTAFLVWYRSTFGEGGGR